MPLSNSVQEPVAACKVKQGLTKRCAWLLCIYRTTLSPDHNRIYFEPQPVVDVEVEPLWGRPNPDAPVMMPRAKDGVYNRELSVHTSNEPFLSDHRAHQINLRNGQSENTVLNDERSRFDANERDIRVDFDGESEPIFFPGNAGLYYISISSYSLSDGAIWTRCNSWF